MALEDLIARSGQELYETMRKGFYERPEEKRQRQMQELMLQGKRQEIGSYPAKQAAQRAKREREIEKHEWGQRNAQQIYDQAVEKQRTDQLKRVSTVLGETFVAGDRTLKPNETRAQAARAAMEANRDRILEEGDDDDDAKFNDMMAITDDKVFMQTYNAAKDLNPHIQKRLEDAAKKKATGTSQFERMIQRRLADDSMTPAQADVLRESRLEKEAGIGLTDAQKEVAARSLRKETAAAAKVYEKAREPFRKVGEAVDGAIAAADTDSNAIADQKIALFLAQIGDPKARAFKMYQEHDKTYGDLVHRFGESIQRFLSGERSPEDRAMIKDFLVQFKKNYAEPGEARIAAKHRALARKSKKDPWQVAPPRSPQEIINSPLLEGKTKEKEKLLLEFFPQWVKENFSKEEPQ